MSEITVPTEQSRAFLRAICERLGIDPACVSEGMNVQVGSEPFARIDLVAMIPAAEVYDIWNSVAKRFPQEVTGDE